ncbi:MAG: hypothetical protein QOE44_522, partial [Solirubrobacteraceae bacterium]|nr:hypothetical protein [Solirubrobacteraceae bacterium]
EGVKAVATVKATSVMIERAVE